MKISHYELDLIDSMRIGLSKAKDFFQNLDTELSYVKDKDELKITLIPGSTPKHVEIKEKNDILIINFSLEKPSEFFLVDKLPEMAKDLTTKQLFNLIRYTVPNIPKNGLGLDNAVGETSVLTLNRYVFGDCTISEYLCSVRFYRGCVVETEEGYVITINLPELRKESTSTPSKEELDYVINERLSLMKGYNESSESLGILLKEIGILDFMNGKEIDLDKLHKLSLSDKNVKRLIRDVILESTPKAVKKLLEFFEEK